MSKTTHCQTPGHCSWHADVTDTYTSSIYQRGKLQGIAMQVMPITQITCVNSTLTSVPQMNAPSHCYNNRIYSTEIYV